MKRIGDITGQYLVNVNTTGATNGATDGVTNGAANGAANEAKQHEAPLQADVCPVCKGGRFLRVEVPFGDPFFGRPIACECLVREQDEKSFSDLERFSQLDPFRNKTFANFDPKVAGIDKAFQYARKFAYDPQGWLVLTGPAGCGKTHLAAAIANQALANRIQALFTVVPDLLDHLRAAFAPTAEILYDELFDRVRSVPLLVLDDLGTEYPTPWAGEKLYQLLNYRYNSNMPTVVTTNRSLGSIDERIRSRMSDEAMCEIVQIKAESYRPRPMGERVDKRSHKPRYRR